MIPSSEIPFSKDNAHKNLPHMLAVMVCFVSLLCAFSSDMYRYIQQQTAQQSQYLYIELPASIGSGEVKKRVEIKEEIERIVSDISRDISAQWVDEIDVEALLAPWLGEGMPLDTLPLPELMEVSSEKLFDETSVEQLRTALMELDSAIQLDVDHAWRGQFSAGGEVLIQVMLGAAVLLFVVTVSLMALLARVHFQLHSHVLELLRRVGARDDYIARQFQWHNAQVATRGALMGSSIGAVLYGAWHVLGVAELFGFASAGIAMDWMLPLASFCLLPIVMVGATLLVTQHSIYGQLRKEY